MPLFGHSKRDLLNAQQEVKRSFQNGLSSALREKARAAVMKRLNSLSASEPTRWAREAGEAIVQLVWGLQKQVSEQEQEIKHLRSENDALWREIEWLGSLGERVEDLREELDRWRGEAKEQGERAEALKEALERQKRYYENEMAALEKRAAAWSRIVKKQEDQLITLKERVL
jgi:peptidoglycan hydrolase CwlO-like protein